MITLPSQNEPTSCIEAQGGQEDLQCWTDTNTAAVGSNAALPSPNDPTAHALRPKGSQEDLQCRPDTAHTASVAVGSAATLANPNKSTAHTSRTSDSKVGLKLQPNTSATTVVVTTALPTPDKQSTQSSKSKGRQEEYQCQPDTVDTTTAVVGWTASLPTSNKPTSICLEAQRQPRGLVTQQYTAADAFGSTAALPSPYEQPAHVSRPKGI